MRRPSLLRALIPPSEQYVSNGGLSGKVCHEVAARRGARDRGIDALSVTLLNEAEKYRGSVTSSFEEMRERPSPLVLDFCLVDGPVVVFQPR
jgi:hypothetical protein